VARTVFGVILAGVAGAATLVAGAPPLLRVCSDPNNLPFSNERQAGFENKIAELAARDMGRRLTYEWAPQRRGFMRRTLMANRCDVVMGVPAGFEMVRTTKPYYRSTYAFVSRRDRHLDVRSFDDPKLAHLVIGIQITGDDYNNPPPAQALASRKLAANVRGYTVYGDYSKPDPQRDVVDAVADGTVDVAVVWGPLAGYFSRREPVPIDVVPVSPASEAGPLRFTFDIAMGVRRDDHALHDALDGFVARNHAAIRRILQSYGVPLV
jgi:quinoprotein dehydrogenase-associated probable ABC transporter substrate-binding protein